MSENQKILLIEDDESLRNLLSKKLRSDGLDVVEAVNGEDALEKVQKENPALIILDLVLPLMDGFEVLRKVRHEMLNTMPIIVLSNLGQREDIDRVISFGANDYLIKTNFTPSDVLERVKKFLTK